MNRLENITSFVLSILGILLPTNLSAVGPAYTVTDVGTLPGFEKSYAYDINASGQIVGDAMPAVGYTHGFLYSNGTMTDMGTNSEAMAINDTGQVVGSYVTGGGYSHAFVYYNGNRTDLGVLSGNTSRAEGINGSGQIAGVSNGLAFIYSNGIMTDLGNLGKSGNSDATDINASGQVVGGSLTSGGVQHAFLYSDGTMTDLGTLPGFTTSYALRINANGEIAGYADVPSPFIEHAFLYRDGAMIDLGTLPGRSSSAAIGLNSSGQVVGMSYNGTGVNSRAFLYSDGVMIDLNSQIDPNSGWTLTQANAINDSGWIAGQGTNMLGQTHVFLLTPIPEPSTLALLCIGAIATLGYAWRKRKTV